MSFETESNSKSQMKPLIRNPNQSLQRTAMKLPPLNFVLGGFSMGSFLKSDSGFLDLFVIPIRIILSPIMLVNIYIIQTFSLYYNWTIFCPMPALVTTPFSLINWILTGNYFNWDDLGSYQREKEREIYNAKADYENRKCSWCGTTFYRKNSGYDWHCCKRCYMSDRG